MDYTTQLEVLDAAFVEDRFDDQVASIVDKNLFTHVQNLLTLKGKPAIANLGTLRGSLGESANVELLAQRYIEEDMTSVSLFSIQGGPEDRRVKSLLLLARRFNEKGKVVEEEYLPIGSTADAQPYFPETRLSAKQIQPRLSFVTATRKRRAKGSGKPNIRLKPTDLHRLAMVGPKVLNNLKEAGIETFEALASASDDLLETVREASGRKLRNFDFSYWRQAAQMAFEGNFDKIVAPPKSKAQKIGKRDSATDFSALRDDDIHFLPKVGPKLLQAMRAAGLGSYSALAEASDEQLEALRVDAGRPFVNFDMSYFRKAAKKKAEGSKTVPAPPSPEKAKPAGEGRRGGRARRAINPNDLHKLPGVGAQLVAALHDAGVNTFSDLANADARTLHEARAKTKGKYKNIDIAYLKRQAKYAAAGQFEKIETPAKVEKASKPEKGLDPSANFQARLRSATDKRIDIIPGVGPGIKAAMRERGIATISDLAKADAVVLSEIAETSGRRFSGFSVQFWIDSAKHFLAGEFDQIPSKAPKAVRAPKPKRKQGGKREAGQPRTPRNDQDLLALPTVGATIARGLNEAGLDTFGKVATASEEQLTNVRDASGPRFKNFDVAYWKEVASLAAAGNYDYPQKPAVAAKVRGERKARQTKPLDSRKLKRLSGVGDTFAAALRENGLNNWQDIVDAEIWKILKAASEGGKRSKGVDPEELKRSAKDALNGKFPERQARGTKAKLPEGHDDFTNIPGLGQVVRDRLYEVNIRTFKDLNKATIGELEAIRDTVRGRVARANVRDWKQLAGHAAKGEWSKVDASKFGEDDDTPKPVAKRPTAPTDGDDLTLIKGIRHKGQQMFRSRGIRTFSGVVGLSDDALSALLDESGPRPASVTAASVREAAATLAGGKSVKGTKVAATPKKTKAATKPKEKDKTKAKSKKK